MDDGSSLPEDRFQALLGRALRREDRERLTKVRNALGIRANDAVWDVMIALDYHLQLYSAVPKQLAAEREKLAAELAPLVATVTKGDSASPNTHPIRRGRAWRLSRALGQRSLFAALALAFGAICIAAGWAMAGRGPHPWGAVGPVGAVLAAPAGWLIFLLLLLPASTWAQAGWTAAWSREGVAVRVVGWFVLVMAIGLIATGLLVLAMALRR